MSVANQKILEIIKPNPIPPFLLIEEDDWIEAFQNLTKAAFGVYLMLAQNQPGYLFEYSPQAIANTGLMTKGTATKARQELENKGYIEDNKFYVQSKTKRLYMTKIEEEIKREIG